jgi:uncharacterized protein HemX
MSETPPPTGPGPPEIPTLGGAAVGQATPLVTIVTVLIVGVMNYFNQQTNHTQSSDDLSGIKESQTTIENKVNSLTEQLGAIKTLQTTNEQQDARLTTVEQTLQTDQADIKRLTRLVRTTAHETPTPAVSVPPPGRPRP